MDGHAFFSMDVNFNSISPLLLSKSGCCARQCICRTPEWRRELCPCGLRDEEKRLQIRLNTFIFFFFFLRRYNFREVLAFSTISFHLVRFLMQSFQFVILIFIISLFTSSSHLFLGLPSDLANAGAHSYTSFYHAAVCHTMYVSKPS
jgi:hypothetical protein